MIAENGVLQKQRRIIVMKGWNYTVWLYRPHAEIPKRRTDVPRVANGGLAPQGPK
jgi:hypothetical protein